MNLAQCKICGEVVDTEDFQSCPGCGWPLPAADLDGRPCSLDMDTDTGRRQGADRGVFS